MKVLVKELISFLSKATVDGYNSGCIAGFWFRWPEDCSVR